MKYTVDNMVGENIIVVLSGLAYKNVKLGCEKGTVFHYCGKSRPFKKGTLINTIEMGLYNNLLSKVKNAENDYKEHINRDPTPMRYLKICEKKEAPFSKEGWLEYVEKYFTTTTKIKQRIETSRNDLADRIPFDKRIVKDAYMSVDEPDCVIILMEGIESGNYWTIDEYKKGVADDGDDGDAKDENEEE